LKTPKIGWSDKYKEATDVFTLRIK